jgi:hypothetical protein
MGTGLLNNIITMYDGIGIKPRYHRNVEDLNVYYVLTFPCLYTVRIKRRHTPKMHRLRTCIAYAVVTSLKYKSNILK